jgi:hypothetical protein
MLREIQLSEVEVEDETDGEQQQQAGEFAQYPRSTPERGQMSSPFAASSSSFSASLHPDRLSPRVTVDPASQTFIRDFSDRTLSFDDLRRNMVELQGVHDALRQKYLREGPSYAAETLASPVRSFRMMVTGASPIPSNRTAAAASAEGGSASPALEQGDLDDSEQPSHEEVSQAPLDRRRHRTPPRVATESSLNHHIAAPTETVLHSPTKEDVENHIRSLEKALAEAKLFAQVVVQKAQPSQQQSIPSQPQAPPPPHQIPPPSLPTQHQQAPSTAGPRPISPEQQQQQQSSRPLTSLSKSANNSGSDLQSILKQPQRQIDRPRSYAAEEPSLDRPKLSPKERSAAEASRSALPPQSRSVQSSPTLSDASSTPTQPSGISPSLLSLNNSNRPGFVRRPSGGSGAMPSRAQLIKAKAESASAALTPGGISNSSPAPASPHKGSFNTTPRSGGKINAPGLNAAGMARTTPPLSNSSSLENLAQHRTGNAGLATPQQGALSFSAPASLDHLVNHARASPSTTMTPEEHERERQRVLHVQHFAAWQAEKDRLAAAELSRRSPALASSNSPPIVSSTGVPLSPQQLPVVVMQSSEPALALDRRSNSGTDSEQEDGDGGSHDEHDDVFLPSKMLSMEPRASGDRAPSTLRASDLSVLGPDMRRLSHSTVRSGGSSSSEGVDEDDINRPTDTDADEVSDADTIELNEDGTVAATNPVVKQQPPPRPAAGRFAGKSAAFLTPNGMISGNALLSPVGEENSPSPAPVNVKRTAMPGYAAVPDAPVVTSPPVGAAPQHTRRSSFTTAVLAAVRDFPHQQRKLSVASQSRQDRIKQMEEEQSFGLPAMAVPAINAKQQSGGKGKAAAASFIAHSPNPAADKSHAASTPMLPEASAPLASTTPYSITHPHKALTAADTVITPAQSPEPQSPEALKSPATVALVIDAVLHPQHAERASFLLPGTSKGVIGTVSPTPSDISISSASAMPQISPSPPSVNSVPLTSSDLAELQRAVKQLELEKRAREVEQAKDLTIKFEQQWKERQQRTKQKMLRTARRHTILGGAPNQMNRSISQPGQMTTLQDPLALIHAMDQLSPDPQSLLHDDSYLSSGLLQTGTLSPNSLLKLSQTADKSHTDSRMFVDAVHKRWDTSAAELGLQHSDGSSHPSSSPSADPSSSSSASPSLDFARETNGIRTQPLASEALGSPGQRTRSSHRRRKTQDAVLVSTASLLHPALRGQEIAFLSPRSLLQKGRTLAANSIVEEEPNSARTISPLLPTLDHTMPVEHHAPAAAESRAVIQENHDATLPHLPSESPPVDHREQNHHPSAVEFFPVANEPHDLPNLPVELQSGDQHPASSTSLLVAPIPTHSRHASSDGALIAAPQSHLFVSPLSSASDATATSDPPLSARSAARMAAATPEESIFGEHAMHHSEMLAAELEHKSNQSSHQGSHLATPMSSAAPTPPPPEQEPMD